MKTWIQTNNKTLQIGGTCKAKELQGQIQQLKETLEKVKK